MLDSIGKDECVETSQPTALYTKETTKTETPTLPIQAANQANIYEEIFNRQEAYVATNITKSLEWRLDQLNRLAQLLSAHTNEFYDAPSRDFKTALSEKVLKSLQRWERSRSRFHPLMHASTMSILLTQ